MRAQELVVHGWDIRSPEFDISQMSVTAMLMLAERGDSPWVALPVFPFRDFHHTRFQVRQEADIAGL